MVIEYDKPNKILYIGCESGNLHLFSTDNKTLTKLNEIRSDVLNGYKCFFNCK